MRMKKLHLHNINAKKLLPQVFFLRPGEIHLMRKLRAPQESVQGTEVKQNERTKWGADPDS